MAGEVDTIVRNAITSDGVSVKGLIQQHASLALELSNLESKISDFAEVLRDSCAVLDESDDWKLASTVYDMQRDLASELGYTHYEGDGEWISSNY